MFDPWLLLGSSLNRSFSHHGDQLEHGLNGVKVLSYELGSKEPKAALTQSKFKDPTGFGDEIKGRILTNHHGETWYRKLRLREVSAK